MSTIIRRLKFNRGVSAKNFGASPFNTAANNTRAIQTAIDAVFEAGGGVVTLTEPGEYLLAQSQSAEVFDNYGAPVAANSACLIQRSGVYLEGLGIGAAMLKPESPLLNCILIVSPECGGISKLSIDGGWTGSGAGHGIFTVNTSVGVGEFLRNYTLSQLLIKNVASYAIGVQNGDVENLNISRVSIFNTGADGIDLKNRGPEKDNESIFLDRIRVQRFGERLAGCAGVDVRGVANLSKIQVFETGRAFLDATGIRLRTASAAAPDQGWAENSTLNGFLVRGNNQASGAGPMGITVGSSDVQVSNGSIENCHDGVAVGGNASASVKNASVSQVVVSRSNGNAFRETTGTENTRYAMCAADASNVGFRAEGTQTKYIGCSAPSTTTPLSVSGGASPTFLTIGCDFGGDYVRTDYITAGRVAVSAIGQSADIDVLMQPKGNGRLRLGTRVEQADAPITGYIEIKDAAGTQRRLAVIG